ncbi:MAG: hypothetical protein JJ899_07900 [Alphaproteobacteria bacterium]|nr:hypothetical protein [Alphaproteobacteria bacterium]
MLKTMFAAGLCGALLATSPAMAGKADVTLSVTSGLPANHAALKIFRERFQKEVDSRLSETGGPAVRWVETHGGTLSQLGGTLEAVEDDLSLFGIVAVNHEAKRLPLQDLTFQMPFTTENCRLVAVSYHAVHRTIDGMDAPLAAARQLYLAPIASDAYNIIAVRKVGNAGDVRAMPLGIADRLEGWLDGVDAVPVPIRADLIASRIEAEVLIGAVLPDTEMRRLGLKTLADHYTRTAFGSQVPYIVTVNARRFADLPEAVRAAVSQAAGTFVSAAADDYCAAGAAALEKMKGEGLRTIKLLKSRREQWASALAPLAQRWAQRNDTAGHPGSRAVMAYMSHLRDGGMRLTRDWTRAAPAGGIETLPAEDSPVGAGAVTKPIPQTAAR